MRGPAARVTGAAAAIGFEAYALYSEVTEHGNQKANAQISGGQYEDRVAGSGIASLGCAMGGLVGATIGQAAIPVPILGAVVGGVVGATAGGFHASSVTGGKQKGGDDSSSSLPAHLGRCSTYDSSFNLGAHDVAATSQECRRPTEDDYDGPLF